MGLSIVRVSAYTDNYIWLLHDVQSGKTAVVDPGQTQPVLDALREKGWQLDWVINTHHHWDHTGANLELKNATGCKVAGAAADLHRIPGIELALNDGDVFPLGFSEANVLSTPGHTTGHICFWFAKDRCLFCGDTLFLMGCGKLMEGDAATMWTSLSRLAALPPDTQIYCAHEYTLANARFASTVDPHNIALQMRLSRTEARRSRGEATVPASLQEELATNPFLRAAETDMAQRLGWEGAAPMEIFTELRHRKDQFQSS
jgi:hydroxyacylglutathione hydrolase